MFVSREMEDEKATRALHSCNILFKVSLLNLLQRYYCRKGKPIAYASCCFAISLNIISLENVGINS